MLLQTHSEQIQQVQLIIDNQNRSIHTFYSKATLQSVYKKSRLLRNGLKSSRRLRFSLSADCPPTLIQILQKRYHLLNHLRVFANISLSQVTLHKIIKSPKILSNLSALFHIQNGIKFKEDVLSFVNVLSFGNHISPSQVIQGLSEKFNRPVIKHHNQTTAILGTDGGFLIDIESVHEHTPDKGSFRPANRRLLPPRTDLKIRKTVA